MSSIHQQFCTVEKYLNEHILGQPILVNRLLIGLLADGHLLVEGPPGLAKTTAIKALAQCIEGDDHRVQFTPDLLPADLTGTEIYRPQEGSFHFQKGPIFHNLLLADEINRAPAKVQSALLEAMGEGHVTIGCETHPLPDLFMVMATQNPIEQEGTYPLPEAQLDRFMLYLKVGYPPDQVEREILALHRDGRNTGGAHEGKPPRLKQKDIFAAREELKAIHLSDEMERYLITLITTTREAAAYDTDLSRLIEYGASVRGTLALEKCARAHAWLASRDYISPGDIHSLIHDVLRHRILSSYEAQAQGVSTDKMIDRLLDVIPVP